MNKLINDYIIQNKNNLDYILECNNDKLYIHKIIAINSSKYLINNSIKINSDLHIVKIIFDFYYGICNFDYIIQNSSYLNKLMYLCYEFEFNDFINYIHKFSSCIPFDIKYNICKVYLNFHKYENIYKFLKYNDFNTIDKPIFSENDIDKISQFTFDFVFIESLKKSQNISYIHYDKNFCVTKKINNHTYILAFDSLIIKHNESINLHDIYITYYEEYWHDFHKGHTWRKFTVSANNKVKHVFNENNDILNNTLDYIPTFEQNKIKYCLFIIELI